MDAQDAIDIGREAILSGLISIGPILLVGLVIAIVIGMVQSAFHLQDQSIAVIPKIVLMVCVLILCLPWLSDRMVEMGRAHFERPLWSMGSPHGSSSEAGLPR